MSFDIGNITSAITSRLVLSKCLFFHEKQSLVTEGRHLLIAVLLTLQENLPFES